MEAEASGVAAAQGHMPWRIVVYKVEAGRAADEDGGGDAGVALTAMVNPVVELVGEDMNVGYEACLSVPGMAGPVPRHDRVRVTYRTLDGEEIVREAEGFHARVIQHECDHLDGILYPSRIEDMSAFGFVEELGKAQGGDPDDG